MLEPGEDREGLLAVRDATLSGSLHEPKAATSHGEVVGGRVYSEIGVPTGFRPTPLHDHQPEPMDEPPIVSGLG